MAPSPLIMPIKREEEDGDYGFERLADGGNSRTPRVQGDEQFFASAGNFNGDEEAPEVGRGRLLGVRFTVQDHVYGGEVVVPGRRQRVGEVVAGVVIKRGGELHNEARKREQRSRPPVGSRQGWGGVKTWGRSGSPRDGFQKSAKGRIPGTSAAAGTATGVKPNIRKNLAVATRKTQGLGANKTQGLSPQKKGQGAVPPQRKKAPVTSPAASFYSQSTVEIVGGDKRALRRARQNGVAKPASLSNRMAKTGGQSHAQRKVPGGVFKCPLCPRSFAAHGMFKLHYVGYHKQSEYPFCPVGCKICGLIAFYTLKELREHKKWDHGVDGERLHD